MRRVRRGVLWVLLCAAMLASAAGCNSGVAEREAERQLRGRLPRIIGPAERYRVNIRSSGDLSVMKGRLGQVTIEGRHVRVGNVWPVDRLLVVMDRVRVDPDRKTLEEVGAARFEGSIGPATLARYLQEDVENLRGATVRLDVGTVTISGSYRILSIWTPFRVSGSLALLDKHRVGLRAGSMRAAGIPIPGRVERYLEQRLNPVLDVSQALLPMELTAVQIRPDAIVVTGIPHLEDPSILRF